MNRNRDKKGGPLHSADHQPNKSSSENILVFLVTAVLLFAVSVFSSHRHVPRHISAQPVDNVEKYVWFTGSAEIQEGLYHFTPEQFEDNFPEIGSFFVEGPAQEVNPPVPAIQYDAEPRLVRLPPAVANIFFLPIPLNRADKNILTALPGVGPVLAERIVLRRTQYGPFKAKEELLLISGIGPKKYGALVDRITLD